ncbi:hypothetical protein V6N11_051944 [Hibiscus sabdariffa]|uniref:Reverse transcriptase domain-containing protein n=1 Tax=Hibiscus sabdariffa TaxID=183260 RepID=A0ABR2U9B8_9ROSI
MLRCCIIDYQDTWEKQLPLVEFAYNNSYQANIQMAPYEALYGRRCRTLVCWAEAEQKLLPMPDILKGTTKKVKLISERLKAASDRQKSYADLKRQEVEYATEIDLGFFGWITSQILLGNIKGIISSTLACH